MLNPTHVAFNFRNFIFDPISLTILVIFHVSSFKTLNVIINHVLLDIVLSKFSSLLKISVNFFKIFAKFSVFKVKFFTFKLDVFFRFLGFDASNGYDKFLSFFKSSGAEDANILIL